MNPLSEDAVTSTPGSGPPESASPAAETGPVGDQPVKGTLGLLDAVSIIVGIVVGAGIYQTAPTILFMSGSGQVAMAAWAIAGVLSFVGALCYAELATTYPRDGGDIVYLSRAYGKWAGFLFGWVQLTVILTGSIGMMAFVFANYAIRLFSTFDVGLGYYSAFAFAGGAILILTVSNVLGVVVGKTIQNVLTLAKVAGLGAIIVAGFMAPTEGAFNERNEAFSGFPPLIGVALVLILYTYGGWNDAAFVAAEVRDGRKNITRALLIGILIITVLYLLVNFAYVYSLGFNAASGSKQIAADVLDRGFGRGGVRLMCVLVMISSLGAVNGLIFTGARVYATVGKDYSILGWMAGWSRGRSTPVPALVTQGVLALALVFLVGTEAGREGINWLLNKTATKMVENKVKDKDGKETTVMVEDKDGNKVAEKVPGGHVLPPIKWEKAAQDDESAGGIIATNLAKDSFDKLLAFSSPVFWLFFLLTGLSVFVLRERDRNVERPFKVPLYPELPLVFCIGCAYMLYNSTAYPLEQGWKGGVVLLGILPLLIGLVLYRFTRVRAEPDNAGAAR
jgi:amino acid transporter